MAGKSFSYKQFAASLTASGNEFNLPSQALAEAIALELQAKRDNPKKQIPIPLTAIASMAIDLQTEMFTEQLLAYADTDVLFYRVENTSLLREQQEALFSPILAWARDRYGLEFTLVEGIMPVAQPEENKPILKAALEQYDQWKLAALFMAAKQSGSLILALTLVEGKISAEEMFALSHLEEEYESKQWGRDEEKEARLVSIKNELRQVEKFLAHLQADTCQEETDFN